MSVYAIDFETAPITPGLVVPPPVCMSVAVDGDLPRCCEYVKYRGGVALAAPALDWLESQIPDPNTRWVGLNIAFDLAVLCEARPGALPDVIAAYDQDRVVDVGLQQKLCDIALGNTQKSYSLQALARRVLGEDLDKGEDTWRRRYWELVDVPLDQWPLEALEYSRKDATTTLEIYESTINELSADGATDLLCDQYRQSRADFALRLMSAWGLRTDPKACAALRRHCETTVASIETELLAAGLLRDVYKGRKPNKVKVGCAKHLKPVQERLIRAADNDWEAVLLSPAGAKAKESGCNWRRLKYISTSREACLDSGDPILETYSEYSRVKGLLTGFVKDLEKGTILPIHPHFDVLKNTGRTGCSGPNIQNVRKDPGVRECFIPRPGFCFLACDIDRAELHTLAQVCINLFGSSTLGDTLNAGIDPHTRFGARLAGISYDDLQARLIAKDPEAKDFRQRAKPANFGFPGGMGAEGMRRYAKGTYNVVLTLAQAEDLKASWAAEYPDIAGQYLEYIGTLIDNHRPVIHFGSNRYRGGCTYCAAANSFFQGMAADAFKQALWDIAKKCYMRGTALHGCRPVNEIHDEVLIEVPLAQASDAAYELQQTMIDAYNTYTRDVPVSAGSILMDRWSKSADAIIEDGTFKIWEVPSAFDCD